MRIIARSTLRAFWEKHADAEAPLRAWFTTAKHAAWRHIADVRKVYPHADIVSGATVFNIKGNDYRLIVRIQYQHHAIYVKAIETHANYDKERWK